MNALMAMLVLAVASVGAAAPKGAESLDKGGEPLDRVPWIENGVWLYSPAPKSGRPSLRAAPELLLSLAASEEARGTLLKAYYFYQRVLMDYRDAVLPAAFEQACLGSARCLLALRRPLQAAALLLEQTGRGGVLYGSKPALAMLEALPDAARADERTHKMLLERLKEWPRPPEARPARPGTRSPQAMAHNRRRAASVLEKARFYLRQGERGAAAVYLRHVLDNFAKTPQAREAALLLAKAIKRVESGE